MHEKCYTFIRLCKHIHEFYIDERPQSVFILGPPRSAPGWGDQGVGSSAGWRAPRRSSPREIPLGASLLSRHTLSSLVDGRILGLRPSGAPVSRSKLAFSSGKRFVVNFRRPTKSSSETVTWTQLALFVERQKILSKSFSLVFSPSLVGVVSENGSIATETPQTGMNFYRLRLRWLDKLLGSSGLLLLPFLGVFRPPGISLQLSMFSITAWLIVFSNWLLSYSNGSCYLSRQTPTNSSIDIIAKICASATSLSPVIRSSQPPGGWCGWIF